MDYINGVGNFLWSSTAAVGNIGYNGTRAVGNRIFGGSSSGGNNNNVVAGSGGWMNNFFWSGQNPSSNPRGGGGSSSSPSFDVRRKDLAMMWSRVGSNFVRVAGLSGALAVSLGAYGAHMFHPDSDEVNTELKHVFEIGNKIHLVHSAALLAIPMTHRPVLAGSLLSVGMLIFCGSCYYHAITEDKSIRWITPYGGVLLIVGWISIAI